jgi:hypothetical protein
MKAKEEPAPTTFDKKEEEDEDPLDAFMADISEKAKTVKAEPKVHIIFYI